MIYLVLSIVLLFIISSRNVDLPFDSFDYFGRCNTVNTPKDVGKLSQSDFVLFADPGYTDDIIGLSHSSLRDYWYMVDFIYMNNGGSRIIAQRDNVEESYKYFSRYCSDFVDVEVWMQELQSQGMYGNESFIDGKDINGNVDRMQIRYVRVGVNVSDDSSVGGKDEKTQTVQGTTDIEEIGKALTRSALRGNWETVDVVHFIVLGSVKINVKRGVQEDNFNYYRHSASFVAIQDYLEELVDACIFRKNAPERSKDLQGNIVQEEWSYVRIEGCDDSKTTDYWGKDKWIDIVIIIVSAYFSFRAKTIWDKKDILQDYEGWMKAVARYVWWMITLRKVPRAT